MNNEIFIKKCYELAIQAGKKGYDTFGAILVHDGKILEEAENTSDYKNKILDMQNLILFTNVPTNFLMIF